MLEVSNEFNETIIAVALIGSEATRFKVRAPCVARLLQCHIQLMLTLLECNNSATSAYFIGFYFYFLPAYFLTCASAKHKDKLPWFHLFVKKSRKLTVWNKESRPKVISKTFCVIMQLLQTSTSRKVKKSKRTRSRTDQNVQVTNAIDFACYNYCILLQHHITPHTSLLHSIKIWNNITPLYQVSIKDTYFVVSLLDQLLQFADLWLVGEITIIDVGPFDNWCPTERLKTPWVTRYVSYKIKWHCLSTFSFFSSLINSYLVAMTMGKHSKLHNILFRKYAGMKYV